MNILILGGSGFLGSHLTEEFLKRKHHVKILDPHPSPLNREEVGHFGYVSANFAYVNSTLEYALEKVDIVYHLACDSLPRDRDFKLWDLTNTLHLLEKMRESDCKRIVFFSSGGTIYGKSSTSPISETYSVAPLCSYGIIKSTIEQYLQMYKTVHGLLPTILRISNPYGKHQNKIGQQGIINTLLSCSKDSQPIPLTTSLETVRDYIHADDVAALCTKINDYKGQFAIDTFNVSSGWGTSISNLILLVQQITGIALPMVSPPLERRKDEIPINVLSNSRARVTFDWKPQISLENGIAELWKEINK